LELALQIALIAVQALAQHTGTVDDEQRGHLAHVKPRSMVPPSTPRSCNAGAGWPISVAATCAARCAPEGDSAATAASASKQSKPILMITLHLPRLRGISLQQASIPWKLHFLGIPWNHHVAETRRCRPAQSAGVSRGARRNRQWGVAPW
jgi:hypothetical protein